MSKKIYDAIVLLGSVGSLIGGVFCALQFFDKRTKKKSRKIVWRVYQLGSFRTSSLVYKDSERVQ